MWESLSPGARVGIVTGIGGGFLAFVFVLVVVILARQHEPPTSPEKSDQAKVTTKASKPVDSAAAAPAKPPEPITTVPAFDPKKLDTPDEKAAYKLGYEQGGNNGDLTFTPAPTSTPPVGSFHKMLCPVTTATKANDGALTRTAKTGPTTFSDTDTWTTTWTAGQKRATATYTTNGYGQLRPAKKKKK